MSRYLVTAGRDNNRVVEAADGATALASLGYSTGTRDAAVFLAASDEQIAALRSALDEATSDARDDDDELRLARCADVRRAVRDAEQGEHNAVVHCLYLYEEMREAERDGEVWP
jgi:hypothetical protein